MGSVGNWTSAAVVVMIATLIVACTCPTPPPAIAPAPPDRPSQTAQSTEPRVRLIGNDHPDFARLEGLGHANQCSTDQDCFVGGCSGEACTATEGLSSTCEEKPWASDGGLCGCVEGFCRWYRSEDPPDPA